MVKGDQTMVKKTVSDILVQLIARYVEQDEEDGKKSKNESTMAYLVLI